MHKPKQNKPIHKKTIGLALGGGGARGIAHIGVLQVFEEHHIPISIIAGCSMGSFIGGAYAAGVPLKEIGQVFKQLNEHKLWGLANINLFRESLLKTKRIEKYVRNLLGDVLIENLKIPFIAVATDLESGKEVDLRQGALWKAMMASASFPPLFPPVFVNNRYLIDGGLLNEIPVNMIRPETDIVIGVGLKNYTSRQFISAMVYDRYYRKEKGFRRWFGWKRWFFEEWKLNLVLMASIVIRAIDIARTDINRQKLESGRPDILIEPDVEDFSFFGFKNYDRIIRAGRLAAERALPQLKILLQ